MSKRRDNHDTIYNSSTRETDCRTLNRYISTHSICVEHTTSELIKTSKCINSVWRHPRHILSITVIICAGRKRLGSILYTWQIKSIVNSSFVYFQFNKLFFSVWKYTIYILNRLDPQLVNLRTLKKNPNFLSAYDRYEISIGTLRNETKRNIFVYFSNIE